MSILRATLLLGCLLLVGRIWVPPDSAAARVQPTPAAVQPNLVVRQLSQLGGQIAGIATSGTQIYLAQANGLTTLDAADPQRITSLGRRAVANEPVRSVHQGGGLVYLATDHSIVALDDFDPTTPIVRANIPMVGSIEALAIQGSTMYMSISNTLQLFDLSSPAHPLLRGSLPLRGSPSDIVVVKNMAYVTYNVAMNLTLGGLDIVDVGNPARPALRGFIARDGANRVAVSGTNAYILTNFAVPEQSGLAIVDVRDLAHPKLRATIPVPGAGEGIQVIGERAYLVGEAGVTTVAIANPSQPIIRGRLPGAAHAMSAVPGRLDLVTDRGVLVTNLANPDLPTPLDSYMMPTGYPNSLQVVGDAAYIVDQSAGIQIVDAHDPARPTVRATIPISGAGDLQIAGQLGYITRFRPYSESEFATVDLTDPSRPLTLGSVPIGYGPGAVQVVGSTAYVSFYPYKLFGAGGFHIIDIHDLTHPHIQSTFIPSLLGRVGDFQVVDSTAYLASNTDGLQMIDVHDPISPTLRVSLKLGTGVSFVAVEDSVAYVVYRDSISNWLGAVNISDPAHPALEASVALPTMPSAYPSDLQVAGGFAYISYSAYGAAGGVAIVDIHDPTALALQRFYETSSVERLRAVGDRLYLASAWSGLELAQIQELNHQARLPLALGQTAP